MDIIVFGEKLTIKILLIVNTETIKPGDEPKVIKKSEAAEPPLKRLRVAAPKKIRK